MLAPDAGCEAVMVALEECHAKGFLWKSMGQCNDAKEELTACLRLERWRHQSNNRNGVVDKKKSIRQGWKEIDENK